MEKGKITDPMTPRSFGAMNKSNSVIKIVTKHKASQELRIKNAQSLFVMKKANQ